MLENYIKNAKLLPNYLPLCFRTDLSKGENNLIDVKDQMMRDRWVEQTKAWVTRNSSVELGTYFNGAGRVDSNTNALRASTEANEFNVINNKRFKASLVSTASISDYVSRLGVWVHEPTIADKFFQYMPLSDEEEKIAEAVNMFSNFSRGFLPMSKDRMMNRLTHSADKRPQAFQQDLTTDGLEFPHPVAEQNSFLAIMGFAAEDTTATTTGARAHIIADGVEALEIDLSATSIDVTLPMFIPALDRLDVEFSTDSKVTNFRAKWVVGNCYLSKRLQMMWGLVPPEADEDLYNEVRAGV